MARYGILKAEYETKLRDMELQLHRERERSNQISFEKKQLSAQVRRLQLENAGLETRVREMKKCAACTCIESRRGRPLHVTESPLKTSKVLSRSTEDLVVDNTTRDLLVDFREKLQTSEDNARRLEVAICERNHTITEQDRAIRSLQHELATIREESEHLRVAAAEAGQLQRRVMELQQALVVAPSPPAPFDMGPLNARLTQIQSEVNIHRTHMDQQEATLATVCAQLAAERKQCSGLIEALRASEKRKNELESERNRLARILESQGEEVETVHARREVEEAMNRHMKANSEKYKKKYEELHEENRRTVEKVGLVEHQLNSERRLADSLRNDLDMARKELINKEERLAELDVILTEMHFGMGQLQADLHEAHSAMSAMDGQIHEMRLACQAYEGQLHDAKDTSECDLRRDLDGAKMEIRQLRQDRIQFQIKLQAQGRDLTETKKKLRSREGLPPVIKEEQPQVSALAEPKMEG